MEQHDIEKYLSNFKTAEAEANLKWKTLTRAKAAWKVAEEETIPCPIFRFKLLTLYACSLVILLLAGIISSRIDNMLMAELVEPHITTQEKTMESREIIELCAEFGMDVQYCQLYARLAQMRRKSHKPLVGMLQERQEQLIRML